MWKKFLVLLFVVVSFNFINVYANTPKGYAIATANQYATMAGIKILNENGNAFDAAVAISAVLAVVEPYHSGLGGGGFWLLHEAKSNENIFIDARESAPLKATKNMFVNLQGKVLAEQSINGGKAALIPGEPAAFAYIAQKYGNLSLSKTLAPAIKLAEEGFIIDPYFYRVLNMEDRLKYLYEYESSRKIFLKNGKSYQVGDLFIQKDLAKTLRILAQKGHDGFYKGEIAQRLVQGVNDAGGIWQLDDLKNYQIKIRQPLESYYKDMKIVTAPLPSSGGVSLVLMLKILSGFDIERLVKVQWIHYISEAMRLAFWERANYLGDPDFIKVDIQKLLSKDNIKFLSSFIKPDKAIKSEELKLRDGDKANHNTTHFSVIDNEGNMVSATLTINHIFGSCLVAEGTGVLLNNEMNDFSLKANAQSNFFGIIGSEKNSIAPNKRPLSNMSPTFLEKNNIIAILGTPGGSRIPTMVLLAALRFFETQSAITMVSSMRFHHQYLPDWLQYEPYAISVEEEEQLKNMGYSMMELTRYYGDMQVITWDKTKNFLSAVSDPRRQGMATVIMRNDKSGYGINF